MIVVVGSCCSICTAAVVVVESIASVSCADCNAIVLVAISDVESNSDDDGCSIIIALGCKNFLLPSDDCLVIVFIVDLLGADEIGEDDDGTKNAVFTLLRCCLLEATPIVAPTHCFI